MTLDAVLQRPASIAFSVLPAGAASSMPYELLKSPRLAALVAELRQRFDYVLVDTPPALPFPDVGILRDLVDGFVLVVRANRTPRETLSDTIGVLGRPRTLGLVFNDDDRTGVPPTHGERDGNGWRPASAGSCAWLTPARRTSSPWTSRSTTTAWSSAAALDADGARRGLPSRVVAQTDRLLDLLDDHGARGTFFTLGVVAQRFIRGWSAPSSTRGHELASHGWDHTPVFRLGADGFRADVRRAKHALEPADRPRGARLSGAELLDPARHAVGLPDPRRGGPHLRLQRPSHRPRPIRLPGRARASCTACRRRAVDVGSAGRHRARARHQPAGRRRLLPPLPHRPAARARSPA